MTIAIPLRGVGASRRTRLALARVGARLIGAVGVLWGAVTAAWLVIFLLPGDPAYAVLSAGGQANPSAGELEHVREQYGFDRPWWLQYLSFLGRVVRLQFGESYANRQPVSTVLSDQLPATVQLAVSAAVVAVVIAVVVSLFGAHRAKRWIRPSLSTTGLVFAALPSFWLGILLLAVFSYQWHLLPAVGNKGFASLVLPTLTLALPIAAVLTQVLIDAIEEVFDQPFIVSARARGLGELSLRLRHVLRHTLVTLSTMAGYIIASLFGGAVITETLFARQGIGRLLLNSINTKDTPVVLAIVMITAAVYVAASFVVDVLYPVIDPRLAEGGTL